jgi:hypothetical protein
MRHHRRRMVHRPHLPLAQNLHPVIRPHRDQVPVIIQIVHLHRVVNHKEVDNKPN